MIFIEMFTLTIATFLYPGQGSLEVNLSIEPIIFNNSMITGYIYSMFVCIALLYNATLLSKYPVSTHSWLVHTPG